MKQFDLNKTAAKQTFTLGSLQSHAAHTRARPHVGILNTNPNKQDAKGKTGNRKDI